MIGGEVGWQKAALLAALCIELIGDSVVSDAIDLKLSALRLQGKTAGLIGSHKVVTKEGEGVRGDHLGFAIECYRSACALATDIVSEADRVAADQAAIIELTETHRVAMTKILNKDRAAAVDITRINRSSPAKLLNYCKDDITLGQMIDSGRAEGAKKASAVVAINSPVGGNLDSALALSELTNWVQVGSWNLRASHSEFHGLPGTLKSKVKALADAAAREGWSVVTVQEIHRDHWGAFIAATNDCKQQLENFAWVHVAVGRDKEACAFGYDIRKWSVCKDFASPVAYLGDAFTREPVLLVLQPVAVTTPTSSQLPNTLALVNLHLKSKDKAGLDRTRAELTTLGRDVLDWVRALCESAGASPAAIVFLGDFNLEAPVRLRPDATANPVGAWSPLLDNGFSLALDAHAASTNVFELNMTGNEGHMYDNAAVWISPAAAYLSKTPVGAVVEPPGLMALADALNQGEAALRRSLEDPHATNFCAHLRKAVQNQFLKDFSDHKQLTITLKNDLATTSEDGGARHIQF